jgi:putative NIF3 family GTP cyclohydrolase 1 type 2
LCIEIKNNIVIYPPHVSDLPILIVAVCAGSGGSVLKDVSADLFITGEMSHHDILDANHRGTSVILCDHTNTERGFLKYHEDTLETVFEKKIRVFISSVDHEPLEVV